MQVISLPLPLYRQLGPCSVASHALVVTPVLGGKHSLCHLVPEYQPTALSGSHPKQQWSIPVLKENLAIIFMDRWYSSILSFMADLKACQELFHVYRIFTLPTHLLELSFKCIAPWDLLSFGKYCVNDWGKKRKQILYFNVQS